MTRYRTNPGERRHKIIFQKLENIQNGYGEPTGIWNDILTTRVAIYPLSGKEFYAAETINSEVTHKINMRYMRGITSDMRIKFNDRYFELISPPINFQERNVELQLLCKEST